MENSDEITFPSVKNLKKKFELSRSKTFSEFSHNSRKKNETASANDVKTKPQKLLSSGNNIYHNDNKDNVSDSSQKLGGFVTLRRRELQKENNKEFIKLGKTTSVDNLMKASEIGVPNWKKSPTNEKSQTSLNDEENKTDCENKQKFIKTDGTNSEQFKNIRKVFSQEPKHSKSLSTTEDTFNKASSLVTNSEKVQLRKKTEHTFARTVSCPEKKEQTLQQKSVSTVKPPLKPRPESLGIPRKNINNIITTNTLCVDKTGEEHKKLDDKNRRIVSTAKPPLRARPKTIATSPRRQEYENSNDNKMFRTLQGAIDQGREFEDLMTAKMALNLTLDKTIKTYCLSANDEKFHPMDDIVLEVEKKDGTQEKYAIQLKYTNSRKILRNESLFEKGKNKQNQDHKGDFNIIKYFEAYQNSEYFRYFTLILATNRNYQCKNEIIFEVGKDIFKLKATECVPKLAVLFGEASKSYKFEISNCNDCLNQKKLSEYQNFFKHFILQTNVMTVQQLEENIYSLIKNNLSDRSEVSEQYIKFIKKWSSKMGRKNKLNETYIKRVIVLLLVDPFLKTFLFYNNISTEISENFKLMKSLIMKFKITLFQEVNVDKIRRFWQNADELPDISTLHRETYGLIRPEIQNIRNLNNREFSSLMWFFGKAPLIVEEHRDVRKAIELCLNENLFFIVLGKNLSLNFKNLIFNNLDCLKQSHPESYEKILKNFYCLIQGKKISLEKLLQQTHKDLSKNLTPDELICCADGSLEIGRTKQNLPPSYIERRLSRVVINLEFLKSINSKICVLISNYKENVEILSFLKKFDVINIKFLTSKNRQILNVVRESVTELKRIFVSENQCTQEDFRSFCSRVPGNVYLHFRFFEFSKLEWVCGKNCDISELKEYQLGGHFVHESELFNYENDNNLNIVCGEPGIGKTSLMKSVANSVNSTNYWTILILVKDHYLHFRNNSDSDEEKFKKYILDQTNKTISSFESTLLNLFMEKRLVRFVWDGLDELSSKNFVTVLKIIDRLSNKGYKQWLTSRSTFRERLEDRYKVVAKTIKKFEKYEQEEYIKERLKNHTAQNLRSVFRLNQENKLHFLKHDFLEVPLQIYMLTELLLQDPSKYDLFDKMFTMPDLYEYFIDIKFDTYYKKLNYDPNNAANEKKKIVEKIDRIENYERVATLVLFEELLSQNEIFAAKTFLKTIQNNQDDYGIITSVSDESKAEFFHNSVAEYFAISYIVKKPEYISLARKYIPDNSNLKYFFDFMVSKNCKAHRAILRKDYKFLKTCSDEELCKKDKVGRSVLHLACSYGTKYPFLRTDIKNDVYIVDDRAVFWQELQPEDPALVEIVKHLLTKCDPYEKDKFNMSCFLYALENNCFLLFLILDVVADLDKFLGTIMYYSVRFDFSRVFDSFEVIPSFKSKHFNKSFLFLAVFYNSANCLKNILTKLDKSFYKKIIESPEEPLVEEAVKNGNNSVLKILVDHGINTKNKHSKKFRNSRKMRENAFISLSHELDGV